MDGGAAFIFPRHHFDNIKRLRVSFIKGKRVVYHAQHSIICELLPYFTITTESTTFNGFKDNFAQALRVKVITGMLRVVLLLYSVKPGFTVSICSYSRVRSGSAVTCATA